MRWWCGRDGLPGDERVGELEGRVRPAGQAAVEVRAKAPERLESGGSLPAGRTPAGRSLR